MNASFLVGYKCPDGHMKIAGGGFVGVDAVCDCGKALVPDSEALPAFGNFKCNCGMSAGSLFGTGICPGCGKSLIG